MILRRFCRASLDTNKLNRKHRYLLDCSSFSIKRNSLSSVPISAYPPSMTGQWPSTSVNHSVLQKIHLMQRTHTAGCHHHGDDSQPGGEGECVQRSCYSVERYREYKAEDLKLTHGGTVFIPWLLPVRYDSSHLSGFTVAANQASSLLRD